MVSPSRAGVVLVLTVSLAVLGCRETPVDSYLAAPAYQTAIRTGELEPTRLQVRGDTLFVAYNGMTHIDAFDFALNPLGRIELQAPEPIRPTAFAVTDTSVVVADHARGVVAVFGRDGVFETSFDRLPDGETRLQPIALAVFRGVAYVADMGTRRVLAISLNAIDQITEPGELILTVPGEDEPPLGFPSAVQVTPDGRLLIGDAERGDVAVFTCEGSRVYTFDAVPAVTGLAPQGFASDREIDASLQDDQSFDPSGVRAQGRIHMVDALNGRIHMFNPLGRYLATYPTEARLQGPAGIATDSEGRWLFVADPPSRRILVYGGKED